MIRIEKSISKVLLQPKRNWAALIDLIMMENFEDMKSISTSQESDRNEIERIL